MDCPLDKFERGHEQLKKAMNVTKPHESIGFGAMDVTKPYEFIGFGAMELNKYFILVCFSWYELSWAQTHATNITNV